MKVLIVGAKGMLGQALAESFAGSGELFLWDRDEIDITESQSSKAKIQNLKPDLVINSAAYNSVDGAETEFELANKINGYAVGNLAGLCNELDIPIVHFSTDYVFDGENKNGYVESDPPKPISKYGESKFLGEQELRKNTDKFYLIRLSKLFGKASLGGKKSFVELMLEAARAKPAIEVIDEEFSCPTYAPDLAEFTRRIIEKKLPFGIYHGANSGFCTWYQFAVEIFQAAKLNVKLIPVGGDKISRLAKRPPYSVLLNTKMPTQQRNWKEALKEFLISNF